MSGNAEGAASLAVTSPTASQSPTTFESSKSPGQPQKSSTKSKGVALKAFVRMVSKSGKSRPVSEAGSSKFHINDDCSDSLATTPSALSSNSFNEISISGEDSADYSSDNEKKAAAADNVMRSRSFAPTKRDVVKTPLTNSPSTPHSSTGSHLISLFF